MGMVGGGITTIQWIRVMGAMKKRGNLARDVRMWYYNHSPSIFYMQI